MCGRFALLIDRPDLLPHLKDAASFLFDTWRPRYNAAPSQSLAVVTHNGENVVVQPMHWGLVPRWVKNLAEQKLKPINARSEGIEERPMFREAFRKKRCLVPMSGFYEWKLEGAKHKQPYFISSQKEPIVYAAGIWEEWVDKTKGECLNSFAILTEAAVGPMRDFHDRQPIFLMNERDRNDWIDANTPIERVREIVESHDQVDYTMRKVSKAVNSPRNDVASVMDEDDGGDPSGTPSLF